MQKVNNKKSRSRRACRARLHIRKLNMKRLTVHRTLRHTYAQIISVCGSQVLASASTLEKSLRSQKIGDKKEAARQVGRLIADRAKGAGVTTVAFDRSGFKYHGRVRALAIAAREQGLNF